jgi:hypothetical protein
VDFHAPPFPERAPARRHWQGTVSALVERVIRVFQPSQKQLVFKLLKLNALALAEGTRSYDGSRNIEFSVARTGVSTPRHSRRRDFSTSRQNHQFSAHDEFRTEWELRVARSYALKPANLRVQSPWASSAQQGPIDFNGQCGALLARKVWQEIRTGRRAMEKLMHVLPPQETTRLPLRQGSPDRIEALAEQ